MALLVLFFSIEIFGQKKELFFTGFRTSDSQMHWQNVKPLSPRKARFTDSNIDFSLDRNYHLLVQSKKNLPDGGIVYLCKDQQHSDVTITLIGSRLMFLYAGANRYQVAFESPIVASNRDSYVESD